MSSDAGTLARITNWEKMAENERKTTLRVITKRNAQRLAALKAKEAESADVAKDRVTTSDSNAQANSNDPVKHGEL